MPGGSGHSRFPTPEDRMVIGKRKDGASWRKTPRVVVPFSTTLTGPVTCPSCRVELSLQHNLWPCPSCDGVFVETAALEAMVSEMAKEPYLLDPPQGSASSRACPACATAMVAEPLATVAIDRCAAHGIWFDQGELATALADSAEPPAGLGGWLKRLFADP